MLDVLHYLLEDDADFITPEHYKSREHVRTIVYENVYDMKYKFGNAAPVNLDYVTAADDLDVPAASAQTNAVKPYIPPTRIDANAPNPFQGTLREGPVG